MLPDEPEDAIALVLVFVIAAIAWSFGRGHWLIGSLLLAASVRVALSFAKPLPQRPRKDGRPPKV